MTIEEYNQIISQIKELQQKVSQYQKEESPRNLFDAGVKPPIRRIHVQDDRVSEIEDCVFEYDDKARLEEWDIFAKLGKLLHRPTPVFYMSETSPHSGVPMVRCRNDLVRYSRYDQLTPQQVKLSAEMVSKMIEIWDEYFKKANPIVKCENRTSSIIEMQQIE